MASWRNLFRTAPLATETPTTGQNTTQKSVVPKIRVVFMGTPEFSATLLRGLIGAQYNIVGVVTKQDKPSGRKQELQESAVKKIAGEHGIPLLQPARLDEPAVAAIRDWKPDLIIVAAYGRILPKSVLALPGFGSVNVHASLLPRWRGASPIQNALLNGDTETGITLMLMDEGLDTGDIIATQKTAIDPDDTQETLREKLIAAAQELLLDTIPLWVRKKITATPQNGKETTLCQLIEREDGHIVWTDSAESIYNRYRALTPWPGIFTFWKQPDGMQRLKLHKISFQKNSPEVEHPIGQVFEIGEKIGIQTGEGIVFLEEIQLEGRTKVSIQDFLRGNQHFMDGMLQ